VNVTKRRAMKAVLIYVADPLNLVIVTDGDRDVKSTTSPSRSQA
jgi:hypothetical protein